MQVFRVQPKTEFPVNPLPAPVLRTRGTGQMEMDLYPTMEKLFSFIALMVCGALWSLGSVLELSSADLAAVKFQSVWRSLNRLARRTSRSLAGSVQ